MTQSHFPEIKTVNLKRSQPWILIGRTDAEAETPGFWSSDANSWLTGKVPHVGKDWGQKEKRVSEYEMAGWHHQCNGHELGQTLGNGEGQGGPVGCSPWGHKESDTTRWLNNNISLEDGVGKGVVFKISVFYFEELFWDTSCEAMIERALFWIISRSLFVYISSLYMKFVLYNLTYLLIKRNVKVFPVHIFPPTQNLRRSLSCGVFYERV